jgi:hypothetical protein
MQVPRRTPRSLSLGSLGLLRMCICIAISVIAAAIGQLDARELTQSESIAQAIYVSDRPLPPTSAENHNEVVAILRSAAKGKERMIGSSLLSQGRCLFILINGGDQPTIDYFMDVFVRSRGKVSFAFDVFRRTKQPLLIPHLAKALSDMRFSSQVVEGDIVYGSFPGMSARGILHILSNCTVFPFVTRATASHYLQHLPTDEKLASGLKDWWTVNEQHFARQAYADVTSLPEIEIPNDP